MKQLKAFGGFWYDFLVGERPELFVGPIVVLLLAWLLLQLGTGAGVAGLVLFVAVVAVGAFSLYATVRPRG